MKTNFRLLIAVLALGTASILPSCTDSNADNNSVTDTTSHQHTFSCPMHPEVTGAEGDNCSKCGMKLEHNDAIVSPNEYYMSFEGIPALPQAEEEVTLSFMPRIKGDNNSLVPLDVVHEKKIHLIIVSADLSYYEHIHPDYTADGTYTVKTKFPAAGDYTLFADYAPSGSTHQLEKITFKVGGTPVKTNPPAAERLTGKINNYEVVLSNEDGFVTNNQLHFTATILESGKMVPAESLENYLGAKAHVVIVGLGEKQYMHVHPDVTDGKFDLHTTFDKPGIYKGWIQFQVDGQIQTADFVLDVKVGKEGQVKGHEESAHGSHNHNH